jgi:hypothetical protein
VTDHAKLTHSKTGNFWKVNLEGYDECMFIPIDKAGLGYVCEHCGIQMVRKRQKRFLQPNPKVILFAGETW